MINKIRKNIDEGVWQADSKIPSEPQLAKEFNVSRATIREAMQELVYSGQIKRVRGVGSFVGHKTISYGMTELVSTSKLLQQSGYRCTIRFVALDVGRPDEKHCETLGISELEPVYKLHRVFCADERAVVYEEAVFPSKYFPGMREEDFYGSSFEMMEGRNIIVEVAEGWVQARQANSKIAEALDVAKGTPLLLMSTVISDQNNRKVVHVEDYFTQWFEFPIRRKRT